MKVLKILFFNLLILFFLIIFIETFFFSVRFILKKQSLGWILPHEAVKNVHAPCLRMITHPILGHTNFHENECEIKKGKSVGEFVYYDDNKNLQNKKILILGGSSSSGFNMHYANGNTWPQILNEKCQLLNKCNIINGAISKYNSSQEALKLLTNIAKFKDEIDIVISFNGINETKFIKDFPFLSDRQIYMFERSKWLVQGIKKEYLLLFPNIQSAIRFATNKRQKDIEEFHKNYNLNGNLKNIFFPDTNIISAVDRWENNIKIMNAISKSYDAKYYVVLQPTLGLKNLTNNNDNFSDLMVHDKNYSKKYLKELNLFYNEAIIRCSKIDFCVDFSKILKERDSQYNDGRKFYYDGRHYNEKGVNALAEEFFKKFFN
jgi:hypothetical protein